MTLPVVLNGEQVHFWYSPKMDFAMSGLRDHSWPLLNDLLWWSTRKFWERGRQGALSGILFLMQKDQKSPCFVGKEDLTYHLPDCWDNKLQPAVLFMSTYTEQSVMSGKNTLHTRQIALSSLWHWCGGKAADLIRDLESESSLQVLANQEMNQVGLEQRELCWKQWRGISTSPGTW